MEIEIWASSKVNPWLGYNFILWNELLQGLKNKIFERLQKYFSESVHLNDRLKQFLTRPLLNTFQF